jgi:hypothetical protein
MKGYVDLTTLYDAPLDPAAMQFTTKARAGDSCAGCVFQRQRVSVCRSACDAAVRAGMEDCDNGVVYILRPADPRQADILTILEK